MRKFSSKIAAGRENSSKKPMATTNKNNEANRIDYKLELFDTIVTHNYIVHLSEYPI